MSTRKVPVVAKWSRFEQSFKSSLVYANPLQDVGVTVTFISPAGQTTAVDGFWDGGKTWRVRFSPDQPGRWSFKASCSDAANPGLDNHSGEFICSAPTGTSRFNRHGPIGVARDHRHFEHADGTPFFWLADSVWDGGRVSEPQDWEVYAGVRAAQQFTVTQWEATAGEDNKKQTAFSREGEHLRLNAEFFKRLDAKVQTLSRAGLLSAIALLSQQTELPEDQAGLLMRYVVARYGAEPVAWLLVLDGASPSNQVARWRQIGQAAFAQRQHAPVIVCAGETPSMLNQFRDQSWVDAVGFGAITDMTDVALKKAISNAGEMLPQRRDGTPPPLAPGNTEPVRPFICFLPPENGIGPESKKRFSADDVRRAAYWSLLMSVPCGLSYSGQGVADWDTAIEPVETPNLPLWHKALFMPGAKQLKVIANFAALFDYWRLRPEPQFVAEQPGNAAPGRFIAAAATETKTLSVVYVPEDRTLEIVLEALPPSPTVAWLNPRTGENSAAVAVVGARSCQFPTPDPGDWLLVMKAGKP